MVLQSIVLQSFSNWLLIFVLPFLRLIQYCINKKAYRGCDYKPPDEEEEDLINRLKRVHLGTNDAITNLREELDPTAPVNSEEQPWNRPEEQ